MCGDRVAHKSPRKSPCAHAEQGPQLARPHRPHAVRAHLREPLAAGKNPNEPARGRSSAVVQPQKAAHRHARCQSSSTAPASTNLVARCWTRLHAHSGWHRCEGKRGLSDQTARHTFPSFARWNLIRLSSRSTRGSATCKLPPRNRHPRQWTHQTRGTSGVTALSAHPRKLLDWASESNNLDLMTRNNPDRPEQTHDRNDGTGAA